MTMLIDDMLPINIYSLDDQFSDGISTFYMRISEDGGLWGPLLEKAYAKLIGNYEFLDGGRPGPSI